MPPTDDAAAAPVASEAANDSAPAGSLELVEVASISRNPRNPRQTFEPGKIEQLAASIEKIGLQVPITVYNDPDIAGKFILLDGERRFRAAQLINLKNIAALVVDTPSENDNAVRMFNIHMLREEWREIETAWALEQIMLETGKTKDKDLQRLTGLSMDRIRNMKRVLEFPKSYQQKVARGELDFHFLVELDKNVLSRQRQAKESDVSVINLTVPELRDVFMKKYSEGVEKDIVDLRRVGTLFDTARRDGKVAERARSALQTLVREPKATIEEAFEVGAAASVELTRVLRDMAGLPSRVEDLLESELDEEQRSEVVRAAKHLCERLAGAMPA
jgi:ParB/RepB/Spo0J family partition protein